MKTSINWYNHASVGMVKIEVGNGDLETVKYSEMSWVIGESLKYAVFFSIKYFILFHILQIGNAYLVFFDSSWLNSVWLDTTSHFLPE